MKKKLLGLALIPFLLSGCPDKNSIPPTPVYCATSDYGNGVYFISGNDHGQCISQFVGKLSPEKKVSIAVVLNPGTHNEVNGYILIVR